jgi:hypothetical protein
MKAKRGTVRQQGAIYDALGLRLALLGLNKIGFDIEVSAKNSKLLHVTCKKTHNRFVVEEVGHNDWPIHRKP